MSPRLRALIIEHERATPEGLVGEWLDGQGAEVEILRVDVEDRDVDVDDRDLIISLGSEYAAYDDTLPWLEREIALVRRAVDADVPVLGICFGGQLLTRVLGGSAFRSTESEIGWLPVDSRAPELVPSGPWFQWHFDTFTVPYGAQLLASSPAGPQAFVHGRSMGVQFHPEVTAEIMERWVDVYRHELDEHGVDPDALMEETRRLSSSSRALGLRLLESFRERVARIGTGAAR